METIAAVAPEPTTGAELRAARERARLGRSEIASHMGTGRQRVVDLELLDVVTPRAAARYRTALEQALLVRAAEIADVVGAIR